MWWLPLVAAMGAALATPSRGLAQALEVWSLAPIFGGADSIVADSQGEFAYVTNGPGLVTIDIAAQSATQVVPTNGSSALARDIDETDSLVALSEFSRGWVADIATGQEIVSTGASSATGAAIAQGFLYVPSFNTRGIHVKSLDGLVTEFIDPTGGTPVALPCSIARSRDATRLFVGDEQNEVVYVIDAAARQVVSTLLVGAPACNLAALDATHLVVVDDVSRQAALFDLTDPSGLPDHVGSVDGLGTVLKISYDELGSAVWVLHWTGSFGNFQSEIVVLTLPNLEVRARFALDQTQFGQATDLAVTASEGEVIGLVATSRGVVFMPEPSRLASWFASTLAFAALARRRGEA